MTSTAIEAITSTGVRLLSRSDLGGRPNVGEGMAIKVTADGRRILYVAHESAPTAYSALDVTDPEQPHLVWQLPTPHDRVRGNSLSLCGDTLLLAWQVKDVGASPAGFSVYDISEPTSPTEVSFYDASGPQSLGVHFVSMIDGRYAHITTGAADHEPHHPLDHQFYMIVDLEDRRKPKEVGRWWLPGTRKGDSAPQPVRHEPFDAGFRLHNVVVHPARPDRAYLGYIDGGMMILDISDMSAPALVSRLDYHPPLPGFTHTVLPLPERNLAVVSDEATKEDGADWPKRVWLVDISHETNPTLIGSLPTPDDFAGLAASGGRIGAHNIHENEPIEGAAYLRETVVSTWFSGGLRIHDISDPFSPKEIAAFVPATPPGQQGSRLNDVFVDDRNIIYAGDRVNGGLYILEYTGERPLT